MPHWMSFSGTADVFYAKKGLEARYCGTASSPKRLASEVR